MRFWRISNFADLSGDGGLLAAGRWYSRGRRVVYLADHPASALVEVLVHLEIDPEDMPDSYQLLAIDIPDDIVSEEIKSERLSGRWWENSGTTRTLGDDWLA